MTLKELVGMLELQKGPLPSEQEGKAPSLQRRIAERRKYAASCPRSERVALCSEAGFE